jgi:hypothetical protein
MSNSARYSSQNLSSIVEQESARGGQYSQRAHVEETKLRLEQERLREELQEQ